MCYSSYGLECFVWRVITLTSAFCYLACTAFANQFICLKISRTHYRLLNEHGLQTNHEKDWTGPVNFNVFNVKSLLRTNTVADVSVKYN